MPPPLPGTRRQTRGEYRGLSDGTARYARAVMPRRDYDVNSKTDLLIAVALIVVCVCLFTVVVVILFTLNSVFFAD